MSNAKNNYEDMLELVKGWRSTRNRYPGWVVVPEDRRRVLWENTRGWIEREFPGNDALPRPLDIEFAFELTWRTSKCLVPIFDNHADFVELILNRYWPMTESSSALPKLVDKGMMASREMTVPIMSRMSHYLLLSMMRYYREEGLSEKWLAACGKMEAVKNALSSEEVARLHYERALFALFSLSLDDVKQRLQEWQENDAHPFWNAKKAALMAEIGLLDEAERVLELSLEVIRTKSNLTPTQRDFTLASQESFVMFLLQAVRHRSFPANGDHSDTREQRREFSGRWHALRQYKCDPWHELELFRNQLERPPRTMLGPEEVPAFDIGQITRTHRLGYDKERMTAYNFLRFCEDSGIPFRMGRASIATSTATGTLPRIATHSSHWALSTLVRIGDRNAVEEVYDRSSLVRLDRATVDNLIEVYLQAVRRAAPDIESGTRFDNQGFGEWLAWVVPEILSRLCCKCSFRAKEKLVGFLLEIYESEQREKYSGIRNLIKRLFEALTVEEQAVMIPRFLRFPIPDDLDNYEQLEIVNPFNFVRVHVKRSMDGAMIGHGTLETLLDKASSESTVSRKWAVTILGKLHDLGMLTGSQFAAFGHILWSQTGEDGFPAGTDYYPCAFLRFPHPGGVDPEEVFMEYVRNAEFPAQQHSTKTEIVGYGQVVLCEEIEGSVGLPWTTEDIRSIAYRLIEWWDLDRSHLKRATGRKKKFQNDVGWQSISRLLRKQVRQLVRTLAIVVARWPDTFANEEIRDALRRVVDEMSEDGIPILTLRLACGPLFPEWWERALQEIENQNASTLDEDVVDAFTAILVVSEHTEGLGGLGQKHEIANRFMSLVAEAIRWRNSIALFQAIRTIGNLVERHPWAFSDEVDCVVLARLGDLIHDTTVDCTGGALYGAGAAMLGGKHTRKEVATRLLIRRESAALAYRLFKLYWKRHTPIPDELKEWERVCQSEEEFAEIRSQWISAESPRSGND